jgi:hypothetical protein
VDFHRVPWNQRLLSTVSRSGFDVVVVGEPTTELSLEEMVTALRKPGGASRHAGLVVYGSADVAELGRQFLGHGVNRVISRSDPDQEVQDSVLSLIEVPRRFHLRTPVHISQLRELETTTAYCHTENLSMSGMLVNCSQLPPVGSLLEFALLFPEEESPIRGRARVARVADPRREKVMGVGAAFESFSHTDRSRLRGALARRWH